MSARFSQRAGQAGKPRLAGALICAWAVLYASAAMAAGPTVVIESVQFVPETLTVKRGETVTWINKDPFPHTVTALGVFDSPAIPPHRAWTYTARKVGEYAYTCTLHPNMKGTLKVE